MEHPPDAPAEAWLKGSIPGYHPVISHLLRASEHIRGDIEQWIAPLPDRVVWSTLTGFHVKHLAGSTERLCTYLSGEALNNAQIAAVDAEHEPGSGLVALVHQAFARYEVLVKALFPESFGDLRYIGRKRIPVTAISLAIHIVEHGQRHTGQAIALIDKIQAAYEQSNGPAAR